MGLFGKKIKKEPSQPVPQQSVNLQKLALSVTAANGSFFHLEPPAEDFDERTHKANPWVFTSSEINGPVYICNPWMTVDNKTGQYQTFEDGSDMVFRVMDDERNQPGMTGAIGRAENITDLRYDAPAYARQKINAAPKFGPEHTYLVRTGHSAYTISSTQGRNGTEWYLDGGNSEQMFAHVKIDDPFNTYITDRETGATVCHSLGTEPRASFRISADANVDDKYKGMVMQTSAIQGLVDYNASISEACDFHTRTACDYPANMNKFAPLNGKGYIGSQAAYQASLHGGFSLESNAQQQSTIQRASSYPKPGILVTTKSGSQYDFGS